jgi:hypothetical protein
MGKGEGFFYLYTDHNRPPTRSVMSLDRVTHQKRRHLGKGGVFNFSRKYLREKNMRSVMTKVGRF